MAKLPFGFDKAEESPGFVLWQTTMIWQRQIVRALETYQVSHAQFVIMASLLWFEAHANDVTQILIINHTKLDKMTVSNSLKKLSELKLVQRQEHKEDSRAKNVYLTNEGKKLVSILVPIVEEIDSQFFGTVTKIEQKELTKTLSKIVKGNKND